MQVEKRSGYEERAILTGMIVDNSVLGSVTSEWKEGFGSKWSNMIGQWCVDYFLKYGKAPGPAIEAIFSSWASSQPKDNSKIVDTIERFLESLNSEYVKLRRRSNTAYIIDMAAEHFDKIKLQRLRDDIEGDLDRGDIAQSLKRISGFNQSTIGQGKGVDLFSNQEAVKQALQEKDEQDLLIRMPQGLGKFFGDSLERDGFIALQGPEKRGKTWWLIELAWRAMLQRRRVAFFEVGDMSQDQLVKRLLIRASGLPRKPGKYEYPTKLEFNRDEDTFEIDFESEIREFDTGVNWQSAWKAMQRIQQKKLKTKEPLLRISTHPNSSITADGVRAILTQWERDGWAADVVVVDYADILAPPAGTADTRDQINQTWKLLRRISQEHHCLVITATQADAGSYNRETLSRMNFSEDKRKYAHVTGMVGLNASNDEKDQGRMRLNWLALREGEYSERRCCHVAGVFSFGSPRRLECILMEDEYPRFRKCPRTGFEAIEVIGVDDKPHTIARNIIHSCHCHEKGDVAVINTHFYQMATRHNYHTINDMLWPSVHEGEGWWTLD